MTRDWDAGCGGSFGVGVFVSIRVRPQASSPWGRFLGVLADYARASPGTSPSMRAAERKDVLAEGGLEHTPNARTRTHTHKP